MFANLVSDCLPLLAASHLRHPVAVSIYLSLLPTSLLAVPDVIVSLIEDRDTIP